MRLGRAQSFRPRDVSSILPEVQAGYRHERGKDMGIRVYGVVSSTFGLAVIVAGLPAAFGQTTLVNETFD